MKQIFNLRHMSFQMLIIALISSFFIISCKREKEIEEEQLTFSEYQQSKKPSGLATDVSFPSTSGTVLLTGMDDVRLIPVYKVDPKSNRDMQNEYSTTYYDRYYYNAEDEDNYKYFMPGIDIIYGYNMVNMGHYDLTNEKLSYFFDHPVLIRTLYFPGERRDSLYNQPVNRDYFMVSVYDEDTNRDSLINTRDMRRMYHFDRLSTTKTTLLPPEYSAIRSTYDYKNDIMYIYARFDENSNGTPEREEPIAIFRLRLSEPTDVRKIR